MVNTVNRVIIAVLDSVGVGELPDAADYGDSGANTLGNVARAVGGLNLPNLKRLGIGNIIPIVGVPPVENPEASYGKMAEVSIGKDTTAGHWELSGVVIREPFPLYPNGFPDEIIDRFSEAIGRGILGNCVASGTDVINQLGVEHYNSGKPIVYTSADSVFQIAAHEGIVPIDQLYEWCRIARSLLTGEHGMARVIARPFTGVPGEFTRTERRKDFSLPPIGRTILDSITAKGGEVTAIGKIEDIFAGRGITEALHPAGNSGVIEATISAVQSDKGSLIFSNLVDFDMLYGHRNDAEGYAQALEAFDAELPKLLTSLRSDDMLILTADHGCDPTTTGTDHTREYVPLLVVGNAIKRGVNLGVRGSFCDVAQTVAEALDIERPECGVSFFDEVVSS